VALDADTKLVLSWLVGERTLADAYQFIADMRSRIKGRFQLTSDGLRLYLTVTDALLRDRVDYAVLHKLYGAAKDDERRYSPARCIGVEGRAVMGDPDPERIISTSYVERQNLTMRMSMRRFTRLTNGFSRKIENHTAAVSLHYAAYNFARPPRTLTKANNGYPTTPAMAAVVADHVWTLHEIAGLLN